VTEEKYGLQLR